MRDLKLISIAIYVLLLGPAPGTLQRIDGQTLQIDSATANWIEGFADFVRWDPEGNSQVIKIAVFGDSEVARYLERRATNRKQKPEIVVVEVEIDDPLEDVNILFVGHGQKAQWKRLLQKCNGKAILTIGEQDGFCESGGCVEFFVQQNLLSFYIHEDNANASGVDIKSQLYAVAKERNR